MKSIVLIIPYFGRLPNYFPIWKMSAFHNETVNFLFFTDIDELQSEKNISVIHMSFDEFRKKVQAKFDFPIALRKPYKLCDYKPTYGYVLSEYIQNYDFWGHCDIDLIFGNIRDFIKDEILIQHQKILEHGHFTLYRNDPETNTVFMRCAGYGDYDYRKALTSDESMYFDEFLGTQLIFRKEGIPTYYNRAIFFDVLVQQKPFQHIDPYAGEVIFRYDGGKLYCLEKIENQIRSTEIMYAHFQKRKMDYSAYSGEDSFYIVPNRLIVGDKEFSDRFFLCHGKNFYRMQKKVQHIREYLGRYSNGGYSSFREYRTERSRFHRELIEAKREILRYGQDI